MPLVEYKEETERYAGRKHIYEEGENLLNDTRGIQESEGQYSL